MGGGVGVSIFGDFRVATDNTLFAMPETGIGLFPDIGGGYFLPRLEAPGLGMYLGLTGHFCNGADVFEQGIATHFVPLKAIDSVVETLKTTNFGRDAHGAIEGLLAENSGLPEKPSSLDRATLDGAAEYFSKLTSLSDLMNHLEADETSNAFAAKTLKFLRKKCPLSVAVTFRQLQAGAQMSLAECLQMELKLGAFFTHVDNHNFSEGVRCALVDRGSKPDFHPATIAEVSDELVDTVFEGLPGIKVDLP